MREVKATALALGLVVTTLEIRRPDDIAPGIGRLKTRADALYISMLGGMRTA